MNNLHWIRITSLDTLPLREGRPVMLAGREIALFNLGDRVFATDNRCPHQGGPLCDGIVTGGAVVCPLHARKIDLESGCVVRPAAESELAVETYPTRVVDGIVLIGLPMAGADRPSSRGGVRLEPDRGDSDTPPPGHAALAQDDLTTPFQGS
jgi:nitrite reductase (NADH) small subunit